MSQTYPDLTTSFPEQIQEFVTMLNIVAGDGPLVKQYQEAVQAGNAELALEIYRQIPNVNQKILDSNKLNLLFDTCVALERFYKTDIQNYVETKQTQWTNIVNQFSYEGVFSTSKQYEMHNLVQYTVNGVNLLYIALADNIPVGTLPTNTTYWRVMTIQGQPGASGVGMSFMYAWNSATAYSVQDVVTYNNAIWGAKLANTNQAPYEGSSYWEKLFEGGQQIYPFGQQPPTSISNGELWFKVV